MIMCITLSSIPYISNLNDLDENSFDNCLSLTNIPKFAKYYDSDDFISLFHYDIHSFDSSSEYCCL